MLGLSVSPRYRSRRTANGLLPSSEAETRGTSIDTGKVVVVICDSYGLVLSAVVVGVTNEGGQPVLFER